jgi:hypothetical protein
VSVDFSEQRFSKGSPLDEFDLVYNDISTVDKETLRTFWNARQGSEDTTWDITLPDPDFAHPTTYSHMQFSPGQRFDATEIKPGRWKVTLKCRRTRKD